MLIGELARRAGTSARALRYYEEQGLLVAERDANGYRTYAADSLLRVRQIRGLLDAGFSSRVVAQLLPCARGTKPDVELCPEVVAAMRGTLERIEADLDALSGRRAAVAGLLGEGAVSGGGPRT